MHTAACGELHRVWLTAFPFFQSATNWALPGSTVTATEDPSLDKPIYATYVSHAFQTGLQLVSSLHFVPA